MSFTKKINSFLNEANLQNIIDEQTNKKLQDFAKEYEGKSIFSFLNVIGLFGAVATVLGAILIISHNWFQISNFTKISCYIFSLAAIHFGGFCAHKNYPKLAQILHFMGAGYVLAGIGLIAQIYHLNDNGGTAYLIWFAMILPLALILKSGPIAVMSAFSFYLWFNIIVNINYYHGINFKSLAIYVTIIYSNMVLISLTLGRFSASFNHVKFFGFFLLAILTLVMGFGHEFFSKQAELVNLHDLTILLLILNFAAFIYCFLRNEKKFFNLQFDRQILIILAVLNLLPFLITPNSAMIISILYWIIWFYASGLTVYHGEKQGSKAMINIGTWCVMIGIITRFIDLASSMLLTGSVFIIFGLILIGIAFVGEKYRKNLINQISINHAK